MEYGVPPGKKEFYYVSFKFEYLKLFFGLNTSDLSVVKHEELIYHVRNRSTSGVPLN